MFGIFTYRKPINYIILLNLLAYIFMFYNMKTYKYDVLAVGFGVILLLCTAYFIILKKRLGDEYLFLIVSMLISLGIMMIYRLDSSLGIRQTIWMIIGIGMFIFSCQFFRWFKKWEQMAKYYMVAAVLLYLITLVLGRNVNGATNWIVIGGQSFQPLEISKVLYILFLACYFKKPDQLFFEGSNYSEANKVRLNRLILVLFTFLNIGFLMLQREWGSLVLLAFIYLIVLYVFGKDILFFIYNIILTIPVALFGYFLCII